MTQDSATRDFEHSRDLHRNLPGNVHARVDTDGHLETNCAHSVIQIALVVTIFLLLHIRDVRLVVLELVLHTTHHMNIERISVQQGKPRLVLRA